MGPTTSAPTSPLPAADDAVAALPAGERWIAHLVEELLPYWDQPAAWGEPRGRFPTLRGQDGRPLAPGDAEAALAPGWAPADGRTWFRMQARQTYLYGVAFHLSGDPRLLALMEDGVRFLRERALERDGGAASWLEGEAAGPPADERTSQDLAYAGLGLALHHHLTRDPAAQADLLALERYVFATRWDEALGMLRFTVRGPDGAPDRRRLLVAQLDQANAYLLLTAPLLPDPHAARWREHLLRLARVMLERFWSPRLGLFRGELDGPEEAALEAENTDFGHTAKALWLLDRIGRLAGAPDLTAFAARQAPALLERAWLPAGALGTWAARPRPGGGVVEERVWWILAELDQLAGLAALADRACARRLPATYGHWLRHMVDHVHGEVWPVLGPDEAPRPGPKVHRWKGGYHTAEHALMAYLTTQGLRGLPATLHFAFPAGAGRPPVRPYLLEGEVAGEEVAPLAGFPERRLHRVRFTGLR